MALIEANEATLSDQAAWGPSLWEEDLVNDKVAANHTYYENPSGLSEQHDVYQTIVQSINGEREVSIRQLSKIRRAVVSRQMPGFYVKQAIQDCAGIELEADEDRSERFKLVAGFFLKHPQEREGRGAYLIMMHTTIGEWVSKAACLGVPAERFLPERGGDSARPKKICESDCPVREDCLQFALVNNIEVGIWGGKSERQRRKIRKERKLA